MIYMVKSDNQTRLFSAEKKRHSVIFTTGVKVDKRSRRQQGIENSEIRHKRRRTRIHSLFTHNVNLLSFGDVPTRNDDVRDYVIGGYYFRRIIGCAM